MNVTYGSCVRIAREAAEQLEEFNIEVELIDVQTLIPFDLPNIILESVKKTGRVIFFDEDVKIKMLAAVVKMKGPGCNAMTFQKFQHAELIFDLVGKSALLLDINAKDEVLLIYPDMKIQIV